MGTVTHPQRAQDTVDMARILFGADYLEDHAVVAEPDQRELAARVGFHDARRGAHIYTLANQAVVVVSAVHPCRGDQPGDGRRRRGADARRRWRGWRTCNSSVQARGWSAGVVRVVDVDAVGITSPSARRSRRSSCTSSQSCRSASERAVPQRWIALRLEGPRRTGRLRVPRTRCSPPFSAAPTSCCMHGWLEGGLTMATRSSCWTWISAG